MTSKWQVVKSYTVLGVEHIWFGIDHLLFVLALKKDWSPVLKKIPAYAIVSVAAFWTIELFIGFWS